MENLCQTITKKGTPCGCKARQGFATCGTHKTKNEVKAELVLCQCIQKNKLPCSKQEYADGMCLRHYRSHKEKLEKDTAGVVWHHCLIDLYTNASVEDARNRLEFAYTTGDITEFWYGIYSLLLEEELETFYMFHPPPKETPKSELHALSLDIQNVHTGVVNDLVNKGLATLLECPPLPPQNLKVEITNAWASKPKKEVTKVVKDMAKWYNVKSCREEDDELYKRALNGLWSTILQSPHKADLLERLWEEASESVGMCCDGHIARLCNVMCGFDDAFKPQVSVGELLQQKIATISTKDLPTHQKVGEAWAVFEELSVPMEERMAWLEAF